MNRASNHAANERAMDDLTDAFASMYQPNSWFTTLTAYAQRGYPTGGDSTGGSNDISRPTERLALTPDTPPAAKAKRLLEIETQLADLAREYHAIYQWTINAAKYDGPEPRPCIVLDCDREITMIGNDIARNGRCPRCAQHYRRHGTEYPNKTTTPAVA